MTNSMKRNNFDWILDHAGYMGDDCLKWPFGRDTKGYGQCAMNGKVHRAHRIMCQIAWGDPPTPKHQASHECGNGNKGCINPRHLQWKTNSENQKDKRRHGTQDNGGGRTGGGKLKPKDKAKILSLRGKLPIVKIAERFGVKRATIDRQFRIAKYGYDTNAVTYRK